MSQPEQQPTLGDHVIADLERQLAEPDPRYARKCRELAFLRSQYNELMEFVRSKADVLGLTEVGADGQPLPGQGTAEAAPVEDETPKVNGKPLPKGSTKTGH